jgi:ribosomal-protein-alanine N-acetyltransferase
MANTVLIETPRLILRTVTFADIEDVALHWKLDEGAISKKEAEEKIKWMLGNHKQNTPQKIVHLCLAIIDKDTQAFIGWCGLDHRDRKNEFPVLFYLLRERYWGNGLGTEAAKAVIDYAFRELDIVRIDSSTIIDNLASKRVMEKIGMRYLGTDDENGHLFTLTKEAYSQNLSHIVK